MCPVCLPQPAGPTRQGPWARSLLRGCRSTWPECTEPRRGQLLRSVQPPRPFTRLPGSARQAPAVCQLPGTGLSHADLLLAFSGPQVLGRQTRSKQLHGSPRNRGAVQQAPQPQPCSNELLPTPVPPTPSLSQKMTTVFVQLLRTRSLAASGPANPAGNAPVRPTGSAF